MEIRVGEQFKNKKHGTLYHVVGFGRHSETLEVMVHYERVEPEEREKIPWDRPLDLFIKKFEKGGNK